MLGAVPEHRDPAQHFHLVPLHKAIARLRDDRDLPVEKQCLLVRIPADGRQRDALDAAALGVRPVPQCPVEIGRFHRPERSTLEPMRPHTQRRLRGLRAFLAPYSLRMHGARPQREADAIAEPGRTERYVACRIGRPYLQPLRPARHGPAHVRPAPCELPIGGRCGRPPQRPPGQRRDLGDPGAPPDTRLPSRIDANREAIEEFRAQRPQR